MNTSMEQENRIITIIVSKTCDVLESSREFYFIHQTKRFQIGRLNTG